MQLQLSFIIAALLVVVSGSPATKRAAAPTKVQIAGTYTDIRYIEEAGDVIGMEIKIIPVGDRHQAAVFVCDGSVGPMRLADVQVRGTTISFQIRESEETSWSFAGTVTAKSLQGTITHSLGGREAVTLPRKCGYWDGGARL